MNKNEAKGTNSLPQTYLPTMKKEQLHNQLYTFKKTVTNQTQLLYKCCSNIYIIFDF